MFIHIILYIITINTKNKQLLYIKCIYPQAETLGFNILFIVLLQNVLCVCVFIALYSVLYSPQIISYPFYVL